MAYALKYRCEFSSYKEIQYRFDISKKDYSGGFFTLQATGKPITQKWSNDDTKPTIKGCNVTFNYLNKGTQPLNIFYSEYDNTFLGTLTNLTTSEVLFVGFLVQDDCNEIELDFTHEVSLSFNDSLGLLKEITLDAAFNEWGFSSFNGKQSLATVLFSCLYATNIHLPVKIYSNVYEATQTKQWSTFQTTLIDTDTFLKDETTYSSCYECLEKIFNALECTLMQSNGCWQLVRWSELRYFNGTNITCWVWDKDFFQVGSSGSGVNLSFGIGLTTYPETGLTKRIQRPYKYVKETYNYKQPNGLIRNVTLTNIGSLISDTISGSVRTKQFSFTDASAWRKLNGDTSRIAIDYDVATNREIQRYIIQPFTGYPAINQYSPAFAFNEIEVSQDDVIDLLFQFRANTNSGVTKRFSIIVNVQRLNGAGGPSSTTNPSWATWLLSGTTGSGIAGWNRVTYGYDNYYPTSGEPGGNPYDLPIESDVSAWQSFSLADMIKRHTGNDQADFPKIPFDGLLKIYIIGWNAPGNSVDKTGYIKDIRFNLKFRINDSVNITGQTHKDQQQGDIKNINDTVIEIDDSPRNSISGTLFIPQKTTILYTRTKEWQHLNGLTNVRLGNLVTFDKLFQRRITRTILEGSLHGLIYDNINTISAISILNSPNYIGLAFVFGQLEIDYRADKATGTLYEMYKQGEVDADLVDEYNFNYLYENK